MQIKNNISTEAVMLEIKDVACDEHEVEIQDRSKNFSLFWFLRSTWKMYRSWKKQKGKKRHLHSKSDSRETLIESIKTISWEKNMFFLQVENP